MFRWFAQNIGNILLSIILAVVVWVVAVNETNPNRTDVFRSIPITFVNKPDEVVAYDFSATAVDVTLNAPESTWGILTARSISVTVDLSAEAPDDTLPVVVGVSDPRVRVMQVEPATVSVRRERLTARPVPVAVNLIGEPAPTYQRGRLTTQPVSVTVRGPASWVEQVVNASGEFSVQNVSQPVSQTILLRAVDANGQAVPNVTLEPERVRLSVAIDQRPGFRDLTVKVELTGTLTSGYRLASVEVVPLNVTVSGLQSTLDALEGFVSTEPIDITGALADFERDVTLTLPSGVSLYRQQTVQVRVKIEPIVGSLTAPIRPVTVGLQPGLAARVSPESVDVILVGALPILDTIDLENDVRVILDLNGLGVGTYQVDLRVEAPEGITAQSVLPPSVQVSIERAPRGTPTPTPTRTPTRRP